MQGQKDNLVGLRSPEFPSGCVWLNSEPLSVEGLLKERKVILLYFWSYSRADCLLSLPHIRQWHERYTSLGLVIIGVHSPEFEFEKNEQNVKTNLESLNVSWPVVLDAEHEISSLYANAFWPRTILVSSKGVIVYDRIGTGGYEDIEREIQAELKKTFLHDIPLPPLIKDPDEDPFHSPFLFERYLGSSKGFFGNSTNEAGLFQDSENHEKDAIYLNGSWSIQPEYIQHGNESHIREEYIAFNFSALKINGVFSSADKSEFEIEIQYNKEALPQSVLGSDVVFNLEHKSILKVKEPRIYNIVDSVVLLEGELKIFVVSDQFQAYTLTFIGGQAGA